jgi:hypothetical protein
MRSEFHRELDRLEAAFLVTAVAADDRPALLDALPPTPEAGNSE